MAKTLVFEGSGGCSLCGGDGYKGLGQIMAFDKEALKQIIQGGAVGAGTAIGLNFIIPKLPLVGRLDTKIQTLVSGGASVLLALVLYRKNPAIATGIGIGGLSVSLYKFVSDLMRPKEIAGMGEDIEVLEGDTGTLVAEPVDYGTIVTEPMEGYGDEIELMEGFGQESLIVD